MFVYGGVARQRAAGLAGARHQANEVPKGPSGGSCCHGAAARRKAGLRRGPVGTALSRTAPVTARGALGDTRVARATPTSLSPQEFLALSLHACHPLIPAALAQMGSNPTLEEITEPEIAAFRITKRK